MRLAFVLFTYFLPLDFPKWLQHFSGQPTVQNDIHSEKQVKSTQKLDDEKIRLRKVLQVWDDSPGRHPAGAKAVGLGQLLVCGSFTLSLGATVVSLTILPFKSVDSYSWYLLLVMSSYYLWERLLESTQDALIFMFDDLQVKFYRSLPLRCLSRQYGRLCDTTIPLFARPYLYRFLAFALDVNMQEADDPVLENYENLGSLFRRAIKSELRPIHPTAELVSPADGTIMQMGRIAQGVVEQVKGVNYSLRNFLGTRGRDSNNPLQNYGRQLLHDPKRNSLYSCVIYLSPADYHRFHSPAEWRMEHRRHFVGDLLSVNPRLAAWIPDLFVLNERVVLSGRWKHGFFSMTAVGATNVGSILVYGDQTLRTNRATFVPGTYYDHEFDSHGVPFGKGDSVGEFKLGSTIVLIYEAPKHQSHVASLSQGIKYGQPITS